MSNLPPQVIEQAKDYDLVSLIEGYGVKLSKQGTDYFGLCPFHNEKSSSFTVNPGKGFYHCFGCGAHGDPIAFVQEFEGVGFRDAVKKLVGNLPQDATQRTKREIVREEPAEWIAMNPVPDSAPAPKDILNRKVGDKWHKLIANKRWEYRNADGTLIGYVYRFDRPGGGKEVMPQVYCMNQETGELDWRWLSFAKPRPLYGLDKLARNPGAQVVVVEGEKACDAAQARFIEAGIPESKLVVVSWPGGGKAVKHTDFSPLYGRRVGLWPDADLKTYIDKHPKAGELMPFLEQPGTVAMLDIFDAIHAKCEGVKFFVPPAGVPDGWDLADPFPEGFNLLAHAKTARLAENIRDEFRAEPEPPHADDSDLPPWEGEPNFPPDDDAGEPDAGNRAPTPAGGDDDDDDDHAEGIARQGGFTVLGYEHGTYYLFLHEKKQIMDYSRRDFSASGLIEIADQNYWELNFAGKNGVNATAAANFIIRLAHRRGIYDPNNVRASGAWIDDDRFIFHHGSYLSVDGVKTDVTRIKSRHVYELTRTLPPPAEAALSDADGTRILDVAKMFRWSRPGSAALLAGWIFLAPICGALRWRPHIWLTGQAGNGKSTILEKFVFPLIGKGACIYGQGNSTEAGVRQAVGSHALPVLLDEAEKNDEKETARVEALLSLIRQSSTESAAETLKGTVSGGGMSFHVRSMFCLASILVGLNKKADIDRLSILTLLPARGMPGAIEHWEKTSQAVYDLTRDTELRGRLLRRAINMMPRIRENIEVFVKVAAKSFGSQRDGDQYGTLLAGAWSLTSSEPATPEDAEALIGQFAWDEHIEQADTDDSKQALSALMGAMIRDGGLQISVHDLISCSLGELVDGLSLSRDVARRLLRSNGVLVEGDRLILPNQSTALRNLLDGTPFAADPKSVFGRLKGATNNGGKQVKFNGIKTRVVSLPLELVGFGVGAADDENEF